MVRLLVLISCLQLILLVPLITAVYFQRKLPKNIELRSRYTSFPMLFFNEYDLADLRGKASTTHRHIAKELEQAVSYIRRQEKLFPPKTYAQFGKGWNEIFGNHLPPLALWHVLKPDPALLRYITDYMDRMTSYSSWLVIGMERDEVPVSHSLIGFATAYDMLHEDLDMTRRKVYGDKIRNVTQFMFEMSKRRWWGKAYLQNHQASNVVSIIVGSLVSGATPGADQEIVGSWLDRAVMLLERTMQVLELIDDGSLDEGVGYVGYTLRSLSQYVWLMKRHFGLDHTQHPWLRKHFDYMYYTIIPGMSRTVGIADSSDVWFYGPESQLYFLDSFILQDGKANWLADEIKKAKISNNQKRYRKGLYTTIHTEFIFYDASIGSKPPTNYTDSEFHHFTDWGVATYRSGSIVDPMASYLSFKSSRIHGKAIYNLANSVNDKTLSGWRAFNPGHEHPDQNSFTFWARGEPFISDGLYMRAKLPYLDNVLMFRQPSPHNDTPCVYPWTGQLGSCGKWLGWQGEEESKSHGEILMAGKKNGFMFIAGDSVAAYTASLGLEHVYRSLLLLGDGLLVVVDHVVVKDNSRLTHLSAYFNNVMHRFLEAKHKATKLSGLVLSGNKQYEGFWASSEGQSPSMTEQSHKYARGDMPDSISNANVTFKLEGKYTSVVYVFASPDTDVQQINFGALDNNLSISLKTNDKHFAIKLIFSSPILCSIEHQKVQNVTTFGFGSSISYSVSGFPTLFIGVATVCLCLLVILFYFGSAINRLCYRSVIYFKCL